MSGAAARTGKDKDKKKKTIWVYRKVGGVYKKHKKSMRQSGKLLGRERGCIYKNDRKSHNNIYV